MADKDRSTELAERLDNSQGPRMGALGKGGMPTSFKDKAQLAALLHGSGLCPASFKDSKQVFVALQYGSELELTPWVSLQNIAVINGRVSLSADMIVALCQTDPAWAGMAVADEDHQTTITMRRKNNDGTVDSISRSFGEKESIAAGLDKKETYVKWKRQMWTARAKAFCGRLAFPGRVAGLISSEEASDIDPEPRDVTGTAPAVPVAPSRSGDEVRAEITDLVNGTEYIDAAERKSYLASAQSIRSVMNLEALKGQLEKLIDDRTPLDVGTLAEAAPDKPGAE